MNNEIEKYSEVEYQALYEVGDGIAKYSTAPATVAENDFILENIALINFVINKIYLEFTVTKSYYELLSAGYIGMLKAYRTHESSKSVFSTYAFTCIRNEILSILRCNSDERQTFEKVDYSGNACNFIKECDIQYSEDSISEYLNEISESDIELRNEILYNHFSVISEKGKEALTHLYGLGGAKRLTQVETANELGISQAYISKLHKKSLLQIKESIEKYLSEIKEKDVAYYDYLLSILRGRKI